MKKEKILYLLERLSMPVLLCVVGGVLLLTPDTASALVGKVAGFGLVAVGVLHLVDSLSSRLDNRKRLAIALVCLAAGGWLLAHPLMLAAWIGRLVGIFFILRGIASLAEAWKLGQKCTWPLITTLAGVLLVLSPMITSRLFLHALGLVLLLVGAVQVVTRLGERKLLEGPDDSDDGSIIDL